MVRKINKEKKPRGKSTRMMRLKKTVLFFSFVRFMRAIPVCLFLVVWSHAQTYSNPVIAGDFPDPSVIRVGEDYYATATSGGWSPIFSIAHSKDLVNWKIVSWVFANKPKWAKGDFWAPEIAEDNGRFYIFYTARRDEGKGKKGTLCVAVAVADKPDGNYQDHGPLVCQEMGSLDAFFIRDEENRPHLVWKEDGNDRGQPTWLYAQPLDESLTRLIGRQKKLFRNEGTGWENHVIEGADIIRRDGWFYMFYSGNACCGRACNYALGMARSRTLLGKWEKNPANPILAANETWQCPGHGTIVKTTEGADYLLYHAYRKRSDAFSIGREALLDKVEWSKDGWATINLGRGASRTAASPFGWTKSGTKPVFTDEFDDPVLGPHYQQPISPEQTVNLRSGTLAFGSSDMSEAVIAVRTVSGDYAATTLIKDVSERADEIVGLSGYSWRGNSVGIRFGSGKLSVFRREGGKEEIAAAVDVTLTRDIYLRMTATGGESYQFAYSLNGKDWISVGKQVVGSHVEGSRVALTHAGRERIARFDWLKIEHNGEK